MITALRKYAHFSLTAGAGWTGLPAAITAAILPVMDCKRTVKQVYDLLKKRCA